MIRKPRISLSSEALQIIKIWATLENKTADEKLSELVISSAPPKVRYLVESETPKAKDSVPKPEPSESKKPTPSKDRVIVDILPAEMPERPERPEMRVYTSSRRPKLAEDPEALKIKIKEAWNRTPRPTYREMANEFGCAKSTISKYISQLKESGEL